MNPNGRTRPNMVIDDNKLRELWAQGLTLAELSKVFGYSRSALSNRAHRLGCKRRCSDPTIMPNKAICQAYEQGQTSEAIAKQLKVASSTIRRILKSRGIKMRKPGPPIDPEVQLRCVRWARQGYRLTQIADMVGLPRSRVKNMVKPILGRMPSYPVSCAPIEELVACHKAGMNFCEMGRKYNRTGQTMQRRVSRCLSRQAKLQQVASGN